MRVRPTLAKHLASLGKVIDAYEVLFEKLKARDQVDLDVDGTII
jgi:hypothetical protein